MAFEVPNDASQTGLRGLRFSARFPSHLAVRCALQENGQAIREVDGHTGNISRGGVLAWLPEPLTPGTLLHFQLKVFHGTVTAMGKVIWQDTDEVGGRPIPHGVQILRFVERSDAVRYRYFLSRIAAEGLL